MQCDQCHERPAIILLTQIIDGEMTQNNLCETCAKPIVAPLPGPDHPASQTKAESQPIIEAPADLPPEIIITAPISVGQLAEGLELPFHKVVAVLIEHKIFASKTTSLDFATASLVCQHHGVKAHLIKRPEDA